MLSRDFKNEAISLDCPISLEEIKDPATTACGHTFEKASLIEWLKEHYTCPVCQEKITDDYKPTTTYLLKSLIPSYTQLEKDLHLLKKEINSLKEEKQTLTEKIYHSTSIPENISIIDEKKETKPFSCNRYIYFKIDETVKKLSEAAEFVLWGKPNELDELIKKDTALLYQKVKSIDPCNRLVYGTLLQLAAGANDFNPIQQFDENKIGIVEKIAAHLPLEEVIRQLSQQFPVNWENKPEVIEKNKREQHAVDKIFLVVCKAQSKIFDDLKKECKNELNLFKDVFKVNLTQLITYGWHFNSEVLLHAYQLLNKYLETVEKFKIAYLCRYVIGFMQTLVSASDAQLFTQNCLSLFYVDEKFIRVDLLDIREDFVKERHHYYQSYLCDGFYLDIDGRRSDEPLHKFPDGWLYGFYKNICDFKKINFQRLSRYEQNQPSEQEYSLCRLM